MVLWDLETGEAIRRMDTNAGTVNGVEFRPDGQAILPGTFDLQAVKWRVDPALEELIAWTAANRYIPELTCAERAVYTIEPLCGGGDN